MPSSGPAEQKKCCAVLESFFSCIWPGSAREWAEALVLEFGNLPAIMAAGTPHQARIVGHAAAGLLAEAQSLFLHCLRFPAEAQPLIDTLDCLVAYLKADMAYLSIERFRVLFLSSGNILLCDELVWEGTADEVPACPREIIKRALELGASGVILVHNHPSGIAEPSHADIAVTRRIADAAGTLGILLHDHILIAREGCASFRQLGLL